MAIRRAAAELLGEVGYDLVTIDAVAARARASKATIYRRWDSLAELVVDTVRSLARPIAVPDTGSLAGDLRTALDRFQQADAFELRVLSGLLGALPRNPELATLFREQVITPRLGLLHSVFASAVERGEIATGTDSELLAIVVPSMLAFRVLLTGEPADPEYADRIVQQIMLPLLTAASSSPGPAPLSDQVKA
ncbi:TetR/AcrR family transcriptional regulator [Streptomyces sp. 8L]|uniref:TetR/AcrR family transcriptional regulator n=1 Tax=Streptomyces sp. 8L TaxID=2877242 RepID=UPI001CD3423A|nr:TetR/AcrR family transcriptional regulator [Streptomyces sp. 8L]MCA1224063.1 TetR/AcrR family transcriptional regulator [Streptomyces sp. 8L]